MKTFLTTFLLIFLLASCQSNKIHEDSGISYQVSKPLVKDMVLNDEYVAQVRSIQHIELCSLEKGYLQKIFVDEGQYVQKGQILFQINPNVYQADVAKAAAEVELSKVELNNIKGLVEKDIISKTELAMSSSKLAKAEAELALNKTHLAFTEIRAPFSGIVGRFGNLRVGSLLDEGGDLTSLSDNHRMWVYFNVPEVQYLEYMKEKDKNPVQKVRLKLANSELYSEEGVIETIESDFSNTSGNIAFRASFDNPKFLLRHGQTGNILWPRLIKQAIIIPQKSTFEILDKKFVYVIDKSGLVHEREIKVADEAPNIFIIKSGINPDEMYLLEREGKINRGDKIKFKMMDPQTIINGLDLYAN